MYLMDSGVEGDSVTTGIFHSSFTHSLSQQTSINCRHVGHQPRQLRLQQQRAAWMISPDQLSCVTPSSPTPWRKAASWHLLSHGWDPKKDCHVFEITEQMQMQSSDLLSLKQAEGALARLAELLIHNPCCSHCRAIASHTASQIALILPLPPASFPTCCPSEGRRDLLFSVWKQGGSWMGSNSLETSGVWRDVLKRQREQSGEERREGKDSRRPSIGRQVIGYFEWSASPVCLPRES